MTGAKFQYRVVVVEVQADPETGSYELAKDLNKMGQDWEIMNVDHIGSRKPGYANYNVYLRKPVVEPEFDSGTFENRLVEVLRCRQLTRVTLRVLRNDPGCPELVRDYIKDLLGGTVVGG